MLIVCVGISLGEKITMLIVCVGISLGEKITMLIVCFFNRKINLLALSYYIGLQEEELGSLQEGAVEELAQELEPEVSYVVAQC
jgi:hypothetical protein